MELSMSLIEARLRRYPLQSDLRQDERNIRGVRFLSDQRLALSPEYVYIGRADQFFSDDHYSSACLLTNGRSRIICFECDYEELLNDVLSAFEFYNSWEQQLRQLGAGQGSIRQMLDASVPLLDTPVLVVDINGRLLGHSCPQRCSTIPEIRDALESGIFPARMLHRRFLDEAGNELRDLTDTPGKYFVEDGSNNAVCMYLCQDGERIGFFQIFDYENLQSRYYLHLQEVIAPYLLQSGDIAGEDSHTRSNTSIITRLLEGEAVSQAALEKFLRQPGLSHPWSLLAAKNLSVRNYTQRALAVREFASWKLPCFPLDYQGEVLVLVSQKKQDALLRQMKAALGFSHIALGISMPIQELTLLPTALRQARFALDRGQGPGIHLCRDYALDYLVENLRNQELVTELLHPAIGTLTQYDWENGTQLLLTLKTYLQTDRSQAETADRLHTHRNTIKYRLERIDQLTGIDLADWQELTWLSLSLLVSHQEENERNSFQIP